MEPNAKAMILGELTGIKGMLSAVNGQLSALNNTIFPVTGPTVMIHSLPMAANAIRTQSDCIDKLIKVIEKIVNA
ncbi:MAG TPA: hypothetical protein VK468_01040 [Pyrinomonadaceae bacterium]|jgi:hypothetical protein|nr:hypothetical protein [Pyrinomonadaceae bacterium]